MATKLRAHRCLQWSALLLAGSGALLAIDVAAAVLLANKPSFAVIPSRSTHAGPMRVLVLGDSLAYGYGTTTRTTSFVGVIAKKMTAQRVGSVVLNESFPGISTAELQAQLRRTPAGRVDLVLIVAGANDIRKLTDPLALAMQERAILAAVHGRYPLAPVLVTNVPDVSSRYFGLHFSNKRTQVIAPLRVPLRLLIALDDTIVDAATSRSGATEIDLHTLSLTSDATNPRFISSDGLHPSDAGHARIARFLWPNCVPRWAWAVREIDQKSGITYHDECLPG